MYGYDQFLVAGTGALFVALFVAVYLQHKIKIYTLFGGKKHDYLYHIIVMAVFGLQEFALTLNEVPSKWSYGMSFWPLGALIFAASIMLFSATIVESGAGILIGKSVFKKHHPKKGKLWKTYKQPIALSTAGIYLGLSLLSGHYAYLYSAALFGIGYTAFDYYLRRLKP